MGDKLGIVTQSSKGTCLRACVPGVSFDILTMSPDMNGWAVWFLVGQFVSTPSRTCRPAGTLAIDHRRRGVKLDAGDCWAILDHGRGAWPAEIAWNWARVADGLWERCRASASRSARDGLIGRGAPRTQYWSVPPCTRSAFRSCGSTVPRTLCRPGYTLRRARARLEPFYDKYTLPSWIE
jgi:hypothetical protein